MHLSIRALFYVFLLTTGLNVSSNLKSACALVLLANMTNVWTAASALITDFKVLDNWTPGAIQVASGEYGFQPASEGKPARMWYRGTANFRDTPHWYWYKINKNVAAYDYIVIVCKLCEGVRLTVDIWFDGKQVVPRPLHYIAGTGDWQAIKIKVLGKTLTDIGLSI